MKWEEAEESNDNVDNSDDNDDANDDYDEDTEFDDDIDDGNDEDYLPEESIPHLDEVVDLKVDIDGQGQSVLTLTEKQSKIFFQNFITILGYLV